MIKSSISVARYLLFVKDAENEFKKNKKGKHKNVIIKRFFDVIKHRIVPFIILRVFV